MRIIQLLKPLILTASLMLSTHCRAEETPPTSMTINLFSQAFQMSFSKDWIPASEEKGSEQYLIEFIPKGEKIENWTQLLAIRAFKNAVGKRDIHKMLRSFVFNFIEVCPQTVLFRQGEDLLISGEYKAVQSTMGCGRFPRDGAFGTKKGNSELASHVIIEGEKDIYIVIRSIRAAGFDLQLSLFSVKKAIAAMEKDFYPIELSPKKGKTK